MKHPPERAVKLEVAACLCVQSDPAAEVGRFVEFLSQWQEPKRFRHHASSYTESRESVVP